MAGELIQIHHFSLVDRLGLGLVSKTKDCVSKDS